MEASILFANGNNNVNQFLGKYVTSPIDGKQYCRKNGQFSDHIQSNGFDGYQHLFEHYNPTDIVYCVCGKKCVFDIRKMTYRQTCGAKECANKITSQRIQQRTAEEWDNWRQKYKETMSQKSDDEIKQMIETRSKTGHECGSYLASVDQRRQTCLERYGNETFNNPQQISMTKLEWDESRKQLFKDRLKLALNGKSLNDFHTEEMYIARRRMLEERGDVIPLNQLSLWERYRQKVRALTRKNYRTHKELINPTDLPTGKSGIDGAHHIDHIVPISYGFLNYIPERLIASVENLQMLPWRDNQQKGKKYDPATSTKHKDLEDTIS